MHFIVSYKTYLAHAKQKLLDEGQLWVKPGRLKLRGSVDWTKALGRATNVIQQRLASHNTQYHQF